MSEPASNFTDEAGDPTPMSRADARLAKRAAINGWPVPMRLKQKVIKKLEQRIDNKKTKAPYVDSAVNALLKMTEQNIQAEKNDKGGDNPNAGSVTNIYFPAGTSEAQRLEGFKQRMLDKVTGKIAGKASGKRGRDGK